MGALRSGLRWALAIGLGRVFTSREQLSTRPLQPEPRSQGHGQGFPRFGVGAGTRMVRLDAWPAGPAEGVATMLREAAEIKRGTGTIDDDPLLANLAATRIGSSMSLLGDVTPDGSAIDCGSAIG